MKTLNKCILCFFCSLYSILAIAQVPQELLDKAKAAGMTEEQIQQEITKRLNSSGTKQSVIPASEQPVTDRIMITNEIPPIDIQRKDNTSEDSLKNQVFGREIFSNKNLSFEPNMNMPTPRNYPLSAGDEVLIDVWGDSELNLKLTLSPEGTIIIPNVGPVALSGLTIEEAENRIKQELGKIMWNLVDGKEPNTFVSVGLGKIRSIKVNIVGEAVAPGTYTLSSLASLFNALYAAGGVNDIGSLRNIRVYRNNKEIANLDVYDYLLNGKYDTNIRLEDNDMIIIEPYEQLVNTHGKIKRNRTFELRKGETLEDLLKMAGGFTGDAFTEDVTIKRKSGSRYQIATVTAEEFPTFVLQDGDSLLVDSVIPFYDNRITITGSVWRPGEYELSPKVHTVKQLIKQAAGLKGDEFIGRAHLTRLNPDFTSTVIAIDIQGIMNGEIPDMELQKEDKLYIPSLFELREPYTVKVGGAVNNPDTVIPFSKNMTVEDAIILAGGLQESASTINVEVARRIKDPTADKSTNLVSKVYTVALSDELQLPSKSSGAHADTLFTLEPFDEVFVRFSPGYEKQEVVKVNGEVTFAGDYALPYKNTRLSDIIAQSGGVTPDAYVRGASLKRQLTEDEIRQVETLLQLSNNNKQSKDSIALSLTNIKNYSVGIDLQQALTHPKSTYDLVLRDGDIIYIPQLQSTVKISGAVTYPNSITYTKGMSVRDCLSQAGGYNDTSRKYPIVIYMNGKVATTRKVGIFFKRYPKIEPGCEIVVPSKSQRDRRTNLAEILSITSSTTSIAAMLTSLINSLK
ncbi:capsule biosynthesis protein [Parabacteroides goldsteinii]|jgi:protein involved in polysaccharide export with SLBB domain|uniref:Capsule biosynthesis protein n=1 Tax=Parabacteroides goldsteinii TaxID=328812 RepID=A0A0J6FAI6_9BACT|nr:SLBB domain-containing protein [Parabacteroides goldsteinii]KMM31717.1 capsule biosynthesis protein [Parabacteroides goldsteinii]